MLLRVNIRFWVPMLACIIVLGLDSALAQVNEFKASLGEMQSPLEVTSGTIEGRVVFQKRFTKVVHEECGLRPCRESQAYWSVLIQSSDRVFLVNQRFQMGSSRVPVEVELGGVRLREGVLVQLEGMLYSYSSGFFVISDLQKVSLLGELGWACQSTEGGGRTLFARVWREFPEEFHSSSVAYRLRVQEVSERRVQTLADVRSVGMISDDRSLVFYGRSVDPAVQNVELVIEGQAQGFRDLPSQLSLFKSAGGLPSDESSGATELSVRMSCSRTRS